MTKAELKLNIETLAGKFPHPYPTLTKEALENKTSVNALLNAISKDSNMSDQVTKKHKPLAGQLVSLVIKYHQMK